jgi:glutaredoxin 3
MNYTVYTKRGCPYCTKIISVLEQLSSNKGIPVVEYVLGTHFSREDFYNEFGVGSTFPQVVYGDKNLGGCSETIMYLKENSLL